MDTKALRQKVLDLAIRGKLVPQDTNDEPASVLLERIRQQKQQMVKDGKLKAKDIKNDTIIFVGEDNLHYEKFADGGVKCIEDEIPFELPDGWAWARLGSLIELFITGPFGSALHKSDYVADGIPLINPMNIIGGKVVPIDKMLVSPETVERLSSFKVAPNDIVIARRGDMGRCAVVQPEQEGWLCGTGSFVLRFPAVLCSEYFAVCLRSPYSVEYLSGNSIGNTMLNLNQAILKSILLPVPPCTEQNRIINSIIDVDIHLTEITNQREALVMYIAKAKSKILDLAIRGQLVPQDPSDEPASVLLEHIRAEKEELIWQGKIKRDKKESVIFRGEDNSYYEKMADGKLHCLDDQLTFELPDGWEWCNLSMIGTTNIGLTYRPTDIEPGGIMVLRSCNIVNDQFDLSDLVRVKTTVRENQFAQKNDILICARNGSRSLVGKCALIPDLGEPASFGAFMAIYRTEYFEFIVHYLRSSFFRSVFDDSNSTAINQLTQDMLKRAIVPLPPLSEQRRIVEAIDAMLFELNQIEKSLS
jgi:type I restriction enzyme S subunit